MNKFIAVSITILTISISFAQSNTKVFKDKFGIKGEITHNGTWEDSILPKQGVIIVKWRAIDSNELKTYDIKGALKNHKPEGAWQWDEGIWDYLIEPGNTIRPYFNATGERVSWRGSFKNGVPNNKWRIEVDSVSTARKQKPHVILNLNYLNGNLFEGFTIEDYTNENTVKISGSCDKIGQADGVWVFEYTLDNAIKVIEERTYKSGIILEISTTKEDKTTRTVFKENKSKLKLINEKLNLDIKISDAPIYVDEATSSGTEIFEFYRQKYLSSGWNLEQLNYDFKFVSPIFRKFEFPLTEKEKNEIEFLESAIGKCYVKIEEVLSNKSLTLNRGRNIELDEAVGYFEALNIRVAIIETLVKEVSSETFKFRDRKLLEIDRQLFANNSEIEGAFYTVNSKMPLPENNDSIDYIEEIVMLYNASGKMIEKHLSVIENNIEAINREKELLGIEESLYNKYITLNDLYNDDVEILKEIRKKLITGIINENIKEYAQTSDYEKAKAKAEVINEKMDSLIIWVHTLEKLDTMQKAIKKQYTNFAYNPYTGKNDIEMVLKKRFYTQINVFLIPYLIENLHNANDWETFNSEFHLSNEVYIDLMTFVFKDDKKAKKIEKKIRQTEQPDKMIKILRSYYENE